jgi:fatty acid synthase
VDTGCSSSSSAFDQAYRAIRDGCCESAVVGGCNLLFHPNISIQLSQLGVLNVQGFCRSFDRDGECRFAIDMNSKAV